MYSERKPLILYADDDTDDIEFVENAFKRGHPRVELLTFPDGFDLVQYLHTLPKDAEGPCLIIVDMNMPRFGGKMTIETIRKNERFSKTPIVIFTTSSYLEDLRYARERNVGFVTKPIDSAQMREITARFIDYCHESIKTYLYS